MERLGRLFLLWASVSAASWLVPDAELQPAALSLDPEYPVYLQGEKVTLTCSAPEEVEAAGYVFYKEQRDQTFKELPSTGQGPYKTFKVSQNTAGKYSCTYWTLLSEQEIWSPHSGLVSVAVTKRLRTPVLSVSPKREVYRSGEFINFTCSVSDSRPVTKIMFHKDDRRLHEPHQLSSSPNRNTYTLRLSPQDSGRYSCTYHVVESGREIQSTKSNNTHISVMGPDSSTAVPDAHTHGSKRRVTRSPAAATTSPLQVTSSHPVTEESSPSAGPDRPATSPPSSSQSTCSEVLSAFPITGAATESFVPNFSRTTSHVGVSSSISPFPDSATPFTSSGGPRSASQPTTASEAKNENGTQPLVVGCSGAAVLFLAFVVWLFRKKRKGNSRRLSRSFWKSLKGPHSRGVSRINCPSRMHLELQEKAKPREVDQDWGILPKSKPVSSKGGDPAIQNQVNDDADSGAEFEFPDLDPTYTLLGYACSTFFLAESDLPAEDSHV
ncbi:uncharacterized protein LOC125445118 isoform X2 [Sphaerodactylus townsendi]|uniref:uncharacterized protein LOC125445118 isoform X2 n=1 Tax=Sphaerodactylus townsendi TaxID=933632 RepID=UPI00202634DF|nr:uncharacterized protein LOC125445118 isoform X2 [Sphaerodactylus townsendi]